MLIRKAVQKHLPVILYLRRQTSPAGTSHQREHPDIFLPGNHTASLSGIFSRGPPDHHRVS